MAKPMIDLYKDPSCGCCSGWAEILEQKGYSVSIHHTQNWDKIRDKHSLPPDLQSCHSAIIDGYLIEGHVPESDIARLLSERPEGVRGLSAPGMPVYSPGMAGKEGEYKGFDVVAFTDESRHIYQQY
jgi:hypothetical protein